MAATALPRSRNAGSTASAALPAMAFGTRAPLPQGKGDGGLDPFVSFPHNGTMEFALHDSYRFRRLISKLGDRCLAAAPKNMCQNVTLVNESNKRKRHA